MVFQSLTSASLSTGLSRAEQYWESDAADRAARTYEMFMHADSAEIFVGDEIGVRSLLVHLAGSYIPHRGEIVGSSVTFSPRPENITDSTNLVEVVSRGSDAPSLNHVTGLGLATLRKEFGVKSDDARFADLASFCSCEEISIRYLPETLLAVPQIGAIEWLAVRRSEREAEVVPLPVSRTEMLHAVGI